MLFASQSNLKCLKTRNRIYTISRFKKCVFLSCTCAFLLLLWLLGRNGRGQSAKVQKEAELIYVDYSKPVLLRNIVQFSTKCDFDSNDVVMVTNETTSDWLNYKYKSDKRIQLVNIAQSEWEKLEQVVCDASCQSVESVSDRFLGNEITKVENLINLHRLVNRSKHEMPLLLCATEKLVKELKLTFDDNGDKKLNSKEQIEMLSSLIVKPAYALMKFKTHHKLNIPIPDLFGTCGRIFSRESDWSVLTDQLKEPFGVRAAISLQVLQIVEDFQEEDPEWYFLNTDFTYSSLMRNRDGEILLVNLQDVAVVDKTLFPKAHLTSSLDPDGDVCNEMCFRQFTEQILSGGHLGNNAICGEIYKYGQLMQSLVCQNVLSDLEEHKIKSNRKEKGLLHSIPDKDDDSIEDLLRECVQETSAGGRKQAVDELREILEKCLNYEDEDEKMSKIQENDESV